MTLTHPQIVGIAFGVGLLGWFIIAHYCKWRHRRHHRTLPTNNNNTILPPPMGGVMVIRDEQNRPTLLSLNRQQHEILKNSLTPSELNYDINDTSFEYVDKIIAMTPEHQLMPLQVLDDKNEGENCGFYLDPEEKCGFCLDPLKCGGRPIVKLACSDHYYHHSCFSTFVEDDKKKKNVGLIFGEIQKVDDMFAILCPICQIKTTIDKTFIEYPNISINDTDTFEDTPVIELDDDMEEISITDSPTELTPLVD